MWCGDILFSSLSFSDGLNLFQRCYERHLQGAGSFLQKQSLCYDDDFKQNIIFNYSDVEGTTGCQELPSFGLFSLLPSPDLSPGALDNLLLPPGARCESVTKAPKGCAGLRIKSETKRYPSMRR